MERLRVTSLLDKLTELEAKAKAAPPGYEWEAVSPSSAIIRVGVGTKWKTIVPRVYLADAEFIAAANPTTILELCAALRKTVEALQSIEWITKYGACDDEPIPNDHCTANKAKVEAALKEIGVTG